MKFSFSHWYRQCKETVNWFYLVQNSLSQTQRKTVVSVCALGCNCAGNALQEYICVETIPQFLRTCFRPAPPAPPAPWGVARWLISPFLPPAREQRQKPPHMQYRPPPPEGAPEQRGTSAEGKAAAAVRSSSSPSSSSFSCLFSDYIVDFILSSMLCSTCNV